ncbi:hypothetical protein RclHR1_00260010 [Rhizophagus clarus]|uniref:Kinase-like domain-containing protein n=1 Tax=Rhizophagus clarus TaxID=94130 RepID=A0A2Z6R182_9GLOM|nr:hypothetical protein RclHR1_00260010 [Rhizophagus clarus]GES90840.1 kinase-like domain-containing protein [Rhizophagus clarus]
MIEIREVLVYAAISKAYELVDYNVQTDLNKRHEFRKKTIINDKTLTEDEKQVAINKLNKDHDHFTILFNSGEGRLCENCYHECLAMSYCEYCLRNYLESKFSDWTSGNIDIDSLIQKCQMGSCAPNMIVGWIPYDKLENIRFLTKVGFSEIYTADWIDGCYNEWDPREKELKKFGAQEVILKKLEIAQSVNRDWFEESKSHLTINKVYSNVVPCYGLTKDPDGNYMLVMNRMDMDLRTYLQQNHNRLTWKERIQIVSNIVYTLFRIHETNAIHRDLHSGNVLYYEDNQSFHVSDFGFCGPVDKPLNSIYGNLPYIAPEVVCGRETTFASDIYSIGMLMWEISSGQPPFMNYEYDYFLAMNIVNGMRPRIIPGTPLAYKELMEQCWDADPTKRPNITDLDNEVYKMRKLFHNDELGLLYDTSKIFLYSDHDYDSSRHNSRIYEFKNLPEPKNATEEQEEFPSKAINSFNIDNFDDLVNNSSNEEMLNQVQKVY